MKNILVPTDFSDCANDAADYAIKLAARTKAKINFLHLQDTPVDWVKLPKSEEKNYPETLHEIGVAKSQLYELIKKAESQGARAEHTMIYRVGKEVVLNHLESHNYDMMVMGSHGAKGMKEKLIGSNAQHMIRNASIPVLVVKHELDKAVKKIVFASDFSDVSVESFSRVIAFAKLLDAELDLLYVDTPKQSKDSETVDENMDKLVNALENIPAIRTNHIEANSVEEGIYNFSKENKSDLVAICTHGKSGLQQLFSPSIAETVANHIELPVLSIRL